MLPYVKLYNNASDGKLKLINNEWKVLRISNYI